MSEVTNLKLPETQIDLPVIVGSEGERAIDVRNLRDKTGYVTFDDGYANTGACMSNITFIDGEKGILRYRGYPIQQLAQKCSYLETAYLLIHGELPTADELKDLEKRVQSAGLVDEGAMRLLERFPRQMHPMAMLSALISSLAGYYPQFATNDREGDLAHFKEISVLLLAQIATLGASINRYRKGLPREYPHPEYGYAQNFLHMLFDEPHRSYTPHPDVTAAFDLIFSLHADHEQNCSTSVLRMVCSGGAHLFASVCAAINALWGPLHGGANMAVINMLQEIHSNKDDGSHFFEETRSSGGRLMGFGHRVYKNYDPRANILKECCDKVLKALGRNDPLLDIAQNLEQKALTDSYFIERKLYPNVDFYSGIILRAIGLPLEMFTVIFAIGRMAGWLAHWKEVAETPKGKIHRPRQIYNGIPLRNLSK
jgi:citrate synthase